MTKLKICGVMTIKEAESLKEIGVDYIGLNFVTESSRRISLDQAGAIMAALKDSRIETVALFRDQPSETVNDYASRLGVDYVQLHGDESPEYASSIHTPVIKAVAVDPELSAAELIDSIKAYPADYFVLDRHEQGQGDIVSTGLAREVMDAMPEKVCLAGGLTPDNLTEIMSQVRPYAIDISSGVRTGESIDISKLKRCQRILQSSGAGTRTDI